MSQNVIRLIVALLNVVMLRVVFLSFLLSVAFSVAMLSVLFSIVMLAVGDLIVVEYILLR